MTKLKKILESPNFWTNAIFLHQLVLLPALHANISFEVHSVPVTSTTFVPAKIDGRTGKTVKPEGLFCLRQRRHCVRLNGDQHEGLGVHPAELTCGEFDSDQSSTWDQSIN